jgi:hypothetical protein
MKSAVPPTPPLPPPWLSEMLVNRYFKSFLTMVIGFEIECKYKVTVIPGSGSICKAHMVPTTRRHTLWKY